MSAGAAAPYACACVRRVAALPALQPSPACVPGAGAGASASSSASASAALCLVAVGLEQTYPFPAAHCCLVGTLGRLGGQQQGSGFVEA